MVQIGTSFCRCSLSSNSQSIAVTCPCARAPCCGKTCKLVWGRTGLIELGVADLVDLEYGTVGTCTDLLHPPRVQLLPGQLVSLFGAKWERDVILNLNSSSSTSSFNHVFRSDCECNSGRNFVLLLCAHLKYRQTSY